MDFGTCMKNSAKQMLADVATIAVIGTAVEVGKNYVFTKEHYNLIDYAKPVVERELNKIESSGEESEKRATEKANAWIWNSNKEEQKPVDTKSRMSWIWL